ncbi:MAG: type II toxin-antitoxin system RelE/ParE family toxin [Pseudomonadota bacterium]
MRIFKNKWFHRFASKNEIDDGALLDAIERANNGLIDADLGGGILKQRIAREGQGKSTGYRAVIFYRKGEKAFFMFGFAKSDQENLQKKELEEYKDAAKLYLRLTEKQISEMIKRGSLVEVKNDKKIQK